MHYKVFLNGVYHGQKREKGAALDLAYGVVNTLQHTLATTCARHEGRDGLEHTIRRKDELSRLMGVLAARIPAARRSRSPERMILDEASDTERISVRRDN